MKTTIVKPLNASEPFDGEIKDIIFGDGNQWVGFTFGSLFILIGIALLFRIPKSRQRVNEYKKRQLELYKKNNPHSKAKNYKQTNLYLPWGVSMRLQLPSIFGVLFIIIGISWIVGNTLTSL